MSRRNSKVNVKARAQQHTGEIKIHFETGKEYRPFSSVPRIESIDAKKKSNVDPRLYSLSKEVPLGQLNVFPVDMSQSSCELPLVDHEDIKSEEFEPEFDPGFVGPDPEERLLQTAEVEWPTSAQTTEAHASGTFSAFGLWEQNPNSGNTAFEPDVQVLGFSSAQCDNGQSFHLLIHDKDEFSNVMITSTNLYPSYPPASPTDGVYPTNTFLTDTYPYGGPEDLSTNYFTPNSAGNIYPLNDSLPSPVQSVLLTPLDPSPSFLSPGCINDTFSNDDLQFAYTGRALSDSTQWGALPDGNCNHWDPSICVPETIAMS